MLVIDGSELQEQDKLREEASNHPLVKRRREIEQQFLDELTRLTRKYGLEIKASTRTEYGETYPDHALEVPYEGTEGRYVDGQFGVEFTSAEKANILPCSADERGRFDQAKKDRRAEDSVISGYNRRLQDMHWKMMEQAHHDYGERLMKEHAAKPKEFHCNCGDKFKTEAALKKHAEKTGHATSVF